MFSSWDPVNELGANFRRAASVSLSFESEIEAGHLAGVSYYYYVGDNMINIKEVANLTQVGYLVAFCALYWYNGFCGTISIFIFSSCCGILLFLFTFALKYT